MILKTVQMLFILFRSYPQANIKSSMSLNNLARKIHNLKQPEKYNPEYYRVINNGPTTWTDWSNGAIDISEARRALSLARYVGRTTTLQTNPVEGKWAAHWIKYQECKMFPVAVSAVP